MAMTSGFTTGWRLSGSFFDPIPLTRPMPIYEALAAHGFVRQTPSGMELLGDAWIWLTPWRYEYDFSAPEEEDERYELYFEHLSGSGDIVLNGQSIASFESGGLRLDITAYIASQNTLAVEFHPVLPDHMADEYSAGLLGPVRLRATNYITLHRAEFCAAYKPGAASIQTDIAYTAHCAGRYIFRYIVSHEGKSIAQCDFPELLRAAGGCVTHTLAIETATLEAEKSPQDCVLDVRVSIERAGIGCDMIRTRVAFERGGNGELWAGNALEFLYGDGNEPAAKNIALAKLLGLRTAYLPGRDARIPRPDLSEWGLDIRAFDPNCINIAYPAPAAGNTVKLLAGKEACWPPSTPAWRVMGADFADNPVFEALYGADIYKDMDVFLRLMRARQAEGVCRLMHAAHIAGRAAYLPMLVERRPRIASAALVEHDGKLRPAFPALQSIMLSAHAFAEIPEDGRIPAGNLAKIPIWFGGGAGGHTPVSVSVACYDLGGRVLGGTSFTAYADKTVHLGDVTVDVPSKPCALVLRILTTGFERRGSVVNDQILVAGTADAPLLPLVRLPETRLRLAAGRLINEGPYAALSLAVYAKNFAYYGALLPGEHLSIPSGDSLFIESLNGRMDHN